jgi:soluble lytic murein transglycosylase-like protein
MRLLNLSPNLSPAAAVLVAAVGLAACAGGGGASPTPSPSPSAPRTSSPSSAPSASETPQPTEPSASASPDVPDPQTVHASPEALAGDLVAAERAIRDPAVTGAELTAWARLEQAMYRTLAATPEWQQPVFGAVPDDLREVVERNVRATAELRALTSPREELPPEWMIVAPPPADELLGHYRAAGDEFGVDWTYLAAIHLVETRMGRIRGTSTAGAQGPMQFMPATWDAYGEGDVDDPGDAIRAAARYLVAHGAPDDMDDALWAYNHSDRYVQAVTDHAAVMRADERAYLAYYDWQVYYRLTTGDVILPVGWQSGDPPT